MSEFDRKEIEDLFEHFLKRTPFAYTLFGNKPVSWEVISLAQPPTIKPPKLIICRIFSKGALWKKWQIWKSYQRFFPFKSYLLIEEKSHCRLDIFLINKSQFIKVVNENQKIFQKILNREISGQSLLNEIEEAKILRPLVKNNDLLLGLLFGFGKHNACFYQERENLFLMEQRYHHLLNKDAKILKTLEKKITSLKNRWCVTGCESQLSEICTVCFAADFNHPETQELKANYTKLRKEITELYSQKNVLEVTLRKLIE